MVDATKFLSDFCKDLVAHPGNRPELIAGYAKHLEARENAIRVEEVKSIDWACDGYVNKRLKELQGDTPS